MPSVAHAHRGGGASGVISPADMAFLREEEKLARDVYITLHDRWGLPIFDQIAVSEQLHTDSVRALLDRHDLYDPVLDDNVGVFTDPFLASLYDQLVNLGLTSEIDALVVGATIEDLDILDITEKLEHNDAASPGCWSDCAAAPTATPGASSGPSPSTASCTRRSTRARRSGTPSWGTRAPTVRCDRAADARRGRYPGTA